MASKAGTSPRVCLLNTASGVWFSCDVIARGKEVFERIRAHAEVRKFGVWCDSQDCSGKSACIFSKLEKCRYCGASLSEFVDIAHGRAYAAVQTYMYVDVRTYVRT